MKLAWQTKILNDGELGNFDFDGPVASFTVGISYFNLLYPLSGNKSFKVKDMGVVLNGSKPSSNVIQVHAALTLDDGSGNHLDASNSTVYVTVLAWLGIASDELYLGISPNLTQGERSVSTTKSTYFSGCFVSSFKMGFSAAESVREASTIVNASPITNGLMVSGSSSINNGSGTSTSATNLTAGLIAATVDDGSSNIEMVNLPFNDPSGSAIKTVSFKNEVEEAIALVSSFDFSFKKGVNITGIYGGLIFENPKQPADPPIPKITIDKADLRKVTIDYQGTIFDYSANSVSPVNNVILLVIAKNKVAG